jgi:hypothetical protein
MNTVSSIEDTPGVGRVVATPGVGGQGVAKQISEMKKLYFLCSTNFKLLSPKEGNSVDYCEYSPQKPKNIATTLPSMMQKIGNFHHTCKQFLSPVM